MAQKPTQFQRPLLRLGSIAFLSGMIITVVSTAIHPSTEDPSNHPLVFAEYASNDSWIAVHIGQFAGVIMVFAGGFVALYRLLVQSESSMASILAWIGLALAIMTASAFAVLQAADELLKRWQYILGLLLLLRKKPSPLELQKGLGLLNMVPIVSFVFSKEQWQ
jgi:magnesium-transporting ATPase (P-type)